MCSPPHGSRHLAALHRLGSRDHRDRNADPDPRATRGELRTRFGTYLLGAGAVGEFGPILLVTLDPLDHRTRSHEALILLAFVALAVRRSRWSRCARSVEGWPLLERTLETSGQLAVRLAVVLVFGFVALATELGLDLLLGGFVAGLITRAGAPAAARSPCSSPS